MANNIDERIVQMRFNNAQFERGAAQSIKTLDQLNKALKLDSAAKSLAKIEDAITKVNFSSLANNVENIGKRFTNLGIVGVTAMQRVSNAAIDAGEKMVKSLMGFENIKAGQSKYETETKAVQTITNATGKSVAEVEKVLETLMKYTDETSYDFAQMVASIGKFTAAGVDLNIAERAMEGIANEAAKSGAGIQEANRAMYNFAQSLSAGYVKLIDWKSIENANMATKEFKEQLIATAIELGTIQKKTENVGYTMKQTKKATKNAAAEFKKTEINYKTFNETLQSGWLTSDVLIKTLEKYADTSTEFGLAAFHAAQEALTFTDAIQAVKDAVSSSWLTSFKLIFGDLDEARSLWTRVANALYDFVAIFNESRNELLKGWHELGGYNDLVEAASNIWHSFMGVLQSVKEAWENVFPPITAERLAAVTKQVDKLSRKIRWIFGDQEEPEEEDNAADKVAQKADTKVMAKAYAEQEAEARQLADKIDSKTSKKKVAALQRELIKKGYLRDKYGADGIYGPNTRAAVKALQRDLGVKVTGTWDKVTKQAAASKKIFDSGSKQLTLSASDVAKAVSKTAANSFTAEERAAQKSAHTVKRYVNDIIRHTDKLNKPINKTTKNIEDIKTLQEQLIRTGFLKTKPIADGIYDDDTENAVRKLQKALGVDITGEWDKATYSAEKHKGVLDEIRQRVETVTVGVDETAQATKKVGDEADKSRKKIEKLNQAANQYNPIKKDTLTKQVEDYKKQHENVVDHDLNALERSTAKINGTVVKDFSYGINTVKSKKEFEKLKKEFSYETKDLQIQLRKAGYLPKGFVADGIYNKQTIDAVKKLQRDLGISVNGVWTNSTKEAVRAHGTFTREVERSKTIFSPDVIRDRLRLFTEGIASAVSVVKKVGEGFVSFFKGIVKMFKPVLEPIQRILSLVSIMFKNLDKNVTKSKINKVVKNALGFLKPIADAIETIANGIHEFVDGYLIAISEVGKNGKRIVKKSKITFDSFFEYLIAKLKENPVVKALGDIWGRIKKTPIVKTLIGWIDTIKAKFDKFKIDWGWIGKIKDPIERVRALIFMLGQTVSKIPGFDLFINFFKTAGSVIGFFFGKVKQFLADHSVKNLPTFFKAIVDSFKSSVFGKIFGGIVNLAGKFVGAIQIAVGAVGNLFGGIRQYFSDNGVKDISTFFVAIFNSIKESPIGQAVATVIDSFKGFFNAAKEYFHEKLPAIFDFFKAKWEAFKGLFTFDNKKSLFENIGDWFVNLKNRVIEAWNSLKNALTIKEKDGKQKPATIFDHIRKMVYDITHIDWESLILPALGVGIVSLIAGIIRNINKIAEGFKNVSQAILLKSGGKYDTFGDTVLKLAGAVAVLAAVCYGLSKVPYKEAMDGVNVLLSLVGSMAIVLTAYNAINTKINNAKKEKDKKDPVKQTKNFATRIFEIGVGIAAISFAISNLTKTFSNEDPAAITKAIVTIGVTLGALSLLEFLLAKQAKTNRYGEASSKISGVLQMCLGLVAVSYAVTRMAKIVSNLDDQDSVWTAFKVIEGLLITLGAIEVLTAKFASKSSGGKVEGKISGILKMSAGLWLITDSMIRLSKIIDNIGGEDVGGAFAMIETLLVTLGTISVLMAALNKGGAKGLTSAAPIVAIGGAIWLIANSLADAIVKIKDVNPDVINGFLQSTIQIAAAFGVLALLFGTIGVGPALAGAAGVFALLAAVAGGMTLIINAGLSAVDKASEVLWLVGSRLKRFSDLVVGVDIERIKAIADLIQNEITGIISNLAFLDTDNAQEKTNKLTNISGQLAVIGGSFSSIGENAVKNAKQMITDTGDLISEMAKLEDPSSYIDILERISGALTIYFKALNGIDADGNELDTDVDSETIKKAFKAISDAIDEDDVKTITSYATGNSSDLNGVAEGVANLGTALASYGENIGKLNSTDIKNANDVIGQVNGVYDKLSGVQWDQLFGFFKGRTTAMSEFVGDMESLGQAVKGYGENISGLSVGSIALANLTVGFIANLSKSLPETGGIAQFFTGEKKLGKFADNMGDLGSGVHDFANAVSDANFTNAETAMGVIDRLANVFTTLDKNGGIISWVTGDKNISNITKGLPQVGQDLSNFQTQAAIFDSGKVEAAVSTLERIVTLFNSINLDALNYNGMFWDRGAFGAIANDFLGMIQNLASFSVDGIEDNETFLSNMATVGSAIVKGINQGIDQNGSTISEAVNVSINAAKDTLVADYSNLENSPFKVIGGYLDGGLEKGINDGKAGVVAALVNVAIEAFNAAKTALDIHSPSKKTEYLGEMTGKGYEKGLLKSEDGVNSASKSVANSLYKNLQGAFSLRSFSRESNRTGSMVGEGLASGVESSMGSVVSSTKKMANALIGSFQQILSIHSPSKKTEELGELTGEGLADGLSNSKKAIHAGAAEMLEPVVDDADDIIKDAKEAGESVSKAYSDGVTEGLEDGADDAAKANKYFTQKISSMNYGGVFTYQADKEAENTKKSNYYNNLESHTLKASPNNALMQSASKLGLDYGSKAGTSAKTGVSSALSSASGEELTSGMGEKLSEGLTGSAEKTDTDSAADTVTSKLKKSFEGSGFMNLDEILFGSNQNGKGGKSSGSFFDGIASTLTNGFNSIFGDEEGKGGIFEGLGETFNTGLGSVGDLFNGENGSGLFSGLFETFTSGFEGLFGSKEGSENEGLWSWLKGEFKSGLDSVAEGVDGPGFFKKLFGFGDEAGEASEKASETASTNITNVTTEAVNKVSEVTAAVQDNVTETAKQAAEAISGAANSATTNVETTSDESKKNVVKATGEAVNGVATVAKNAAKTVSDTATLTTEDISNLRAMIESFNEVVNSKIDTAPSIRPVIDYSALEGSASKIRELLGMDDVMTSINTHNSGALATSVAVNAVNNSVIGIHDTITKNHEAAMRMYSDMSDKLETIDRDMTKLKIYLDSDAIVVGTVDKMDRALGKKRGRQQTR